MNYSAIDIQGNIVSSEILEKIRTEDTKFQQASDFGLEKKVSVRDEIGLAWAAARAHWTAFQLRVTRLREGESGVGETRNSWMIPLLRELGYDVERAPAYVHPDTQKSYAISHRAANRAGFPIHIMGIHDSLDKRREGSGPRLSPHALVQEYLNNTDHLYALVTNGTTLRLLRDATRLVRLSYLEFDLSRIMEEELYSEFAILFRLLHVTRMPVDLDSKEESFVEYYHQDSLSTGSRIREKLSIAVEQSIKTLANGFLQHPRNTELREQVVQGTITASTFYLFQLRLIYRFLFLMVTEERNLVYPPLPPQEGGKAPSRPPQGTPSQPPPEGGGDLSRLRKIYYEHYSIGRLRRLSRKMIFVDGRKFDLWDGVISTFQLFEDGAYGSKLGISPLGSGLFSPDALGILSECKLDNKSLLKVIGSLTQFENDQRQLVEVNYSDLDVEEFGSVYEGLLEYDARFAEYKGQPSFEFVEGTGRSVSGSHYTPEELVKPLIKHSLEYIIEDRLKEPDKEKALLSITVCDVACGSGHILLSAARRIALELAIVRTNEEQPSPSAIRHAIRDVIKSCIYGVDKNPLAVELCKVAFWLEAHNPGEPLNFLDHHVKCGDSIIGLAHIEELKNGISNEAFKTLPGDDKEIASAFSKRNKKERETAGQISLDFDAAVKTKMARVIEELSQFDLLPEKTPAEIREKAEAYDRLVNNRNWQRLRELANVMVAQFFISKSIQNKDCLVTDAYYREYLNGTKGIPGQAIGKSEAVAHERKFFHWFLEFPEVSSNGGFDCVLGNPPFLGDRRLKEAFGEHFLEWIRFWYTDGATVDLVVYFFLRIHSLIRAKGFLSLISTNTVAQGKAREHGLEKIISGGSTINHAVKSTKWPGFAAVEVSLVTLFKGKWIKELFLNGKVIDQISPFLDEAENSGTPFPLFSNKGKSYQGSIILGMGFVLDPHEAINLVELDPNNCNVIFPYLNGDDLNNNPDQNPSRYVINFFDWEEEHASQYFAPFHIIEEKVKPERQRWKKDKNGDPVIGHFALRYPLPQRWWQHAEKRPALYSSAKAFERVLVSCRVSKYVNQSFIEVGPIFDVATSVVLRSEYWEYAFLQNSLHNEWAWKYASTLESRIRYVNGDCIDTFPVLINLTHELKQAVAAIGEIHYEQRKELMLSIQLGLTKTYNLFHHRLLRTITEVEGNQEDKQFEKILGKDALMLKKHLAKTPSSM